MATDPLQDAAVTNCASTRSDLRETEDQFRIALECSPQGFIILRSLRDEHGRIVDFVWTYANRAAAEILRRTPDQLVGQRLLQILPGTQENQALFERYVRITETGQADEIELRYQADGIDGWFRNVTVKLGDGVAVAFSDITARKQAEAILQRSQGELEGRVAERTEALAAVNRRLEAELAERQRTEAALRASEERYRCIVETADEGIWTVDADWNTTFVNARLAEMLGFSPEEMLGRHLFDFMDSASQGTAEILMSRREQGIQEKHDFPFRRRNGTALWAIVSATPLLDADGQFRGGLALLTDITFRKQTEEALRTSHERYRTLAENTSDVIARFDRAGRHLYVNPATTRLTGQSPRAHLGKTHRELGFPPDQCARWEARLETAFATGQPVHDYVEWAGPTGTIHLDWWLYPERDAAGRVISVLSNMHDITERRRVEEILRASEAELRQSNATKDKFFSIIAHDLKHPLINLQTGLALLRQAPESERSSLVSELEDDAQRLMQLLENLLTWARLEQGHLAPALLPVDLRHLVNDVLRLLAPLAVRKQIALTVAPLPRPLRVIADENMLKTVVRNLVTNALKFTRKGGEVNLAAREGNDRIELVVADTGIGIPANELERVFRLDVKTQRKGTGGEAGTGLGLILCKQFLELQSSTLRLESAEGHGTRVCVTLPRAAT